MNPDELLRSVRQRARTFPAPTGSAEAALVQLRNRCADFFSRATEPPVYLRGEDPRRAQAAVLRDEGAELLVAGLAFLREAGEVGEARPLLEALESHVGALCHLADGKLKEAEAAWGEAQARERFALAGKRVWKRSDEARSVFDKQSGLSRYDPKEDADVQLKLVCPTCRQTGAFTFPARGSQQRLTCPRCTTAFLGFFGEVRGAVVRAEGSERRYVVELEELEGGLSRVEFSDASNTELSLTRADFVAFVYSAERELRCVVNLSNGRILWVTKPGPCFLATAAFGEGASELVAFRQFRDEVLLRSRGGTLAVRAYYRLGPGMARWVVARPRVRQELRRSLTAFHRVLVARQGGHP